jgi:predicted nuclease of predicted toxin-antitoxin system
VAGRFPLLTDENIDGPLIGALRSAGWEVALAGEIFGERTDDEVLFEYAAYHGLVLVSTDQDHLEIADRWLREWKPFRLLTWEQGPYQHVRPRAFVSAFEELAASEEPFAGGYPIVHLKPRI